MMRAKAAARATPAPAPSPLPLLVTATAIYLGWVNRDEGLLVAEHGAGYALGIVGGALMCLIPLYSLRKRVRPLRRAGKVRHWFRAHMLAGVVGPVLILFHCNFETGSMNSTIALASMLAVVASGVVGRWLYTGIHRGLYGRRTSLEELRLDSRAAAARIEPLMAASPRLRRRLGAFAEVVAERPSGLLAGGLRVLDLEIRTPWTLVVAAATLLRARVSVALQDEAVAAGGRPSIRRALAAVSDHLEAVRRVAVFGFYERLFALWHVFHVPLFLLLVISATVHVVAVHLY